jgi:osmotically-inducible protein OsmY
MTGAPFNADPSARDEDELAFEIQLALRATGYPALRNLAVVVRDGVVSLRGRVPSYYMIQIANAAATCVAGVREVRIEPGVTGGSRPAG